MIAEHIYSTVYCSVHVQLAKFNLGGSFVVISAELFSLDANNIANIQFISPECHVAEPCSSLRTNVVE